MRELTISILEAQALEVILYAINSHRHAAIPAVTCKSVSIDVLLQ